MGTRHLISVVVDGEHKIAQYGQWDGYPEGQGVSVLSFMEQLVEDEAVDDFIAKVRDLDELADERRKALWVECGADPDSDLVTMDVSDNFNRRYPHLSRDCGADVLGLVAQGKATEVSLAKDFAKDSLFCEYAYVIDLDERVLEVYAGFQKLPHDSGRYALGKASDRGYFPVALVASFSLASLPDKDAFLSEVRDGEHEHAVSVRDKAIKRLERENKELAERLADKSYKLQEAQRTRP